MRRIISFLLAIGICTIAVAQTSNPIFRRPSNGGRPTPIADELEGRTINYWAVSNNSSVEWFYGWGGSAARFGAIGLTTPVASRYGQYPGFNSIATAAGLAAGHAFRSTAMTVGLVSRQTGFTLSFVVRAGDVAYSASDSVFCGIARGTQVWDTTPFNASPILDSIYIGFDGVNGISNFSVCSNDSTGSATCVDLGLSRNNNALFDVTFVADPIDTSSVAYSIYIRDTDQSIVGTLTTDLPIVNTALRPACSISNNTSGTDVAIILTSMYLETPY